MSDCRYCGLSTLQTTLMLVDHRLFDGGLPLLNRFHLNTRCKAEDLNEAEVGICCEEYACVDIVHLRGELLLLAKDPSLNAKKIQALWGSLEGDFELGVALLANPNVPIQFVREQAPYYFEGVLENPSLMLWLLEDPDFLHRIAREFIPEAGYGVDRGWRTPCSVAWLRYLAASAEVTHRRFAASHSDLPNDCAWTLADDPDPCTRGYLSYHSKDYELLWYLAQDPDLETREIAARAGSHPSVMAHLTADASKTVRFFVAASDWRLNEIPSYLRWGLYAEPTFGESYPHLPLAEKEQHQQRFATRAHQRKRKTKEYTHQERRQEREFYQRNFR
jgi:hypothetical protein